jgi:hypothetical protein
MGKQLVAYVAGPFRSSSAYVANHQDMWGVQKNVMHAMELARQAWLEGFAVICPHANTMFFTGAAPDSVWLDGDLELLRRSDAVLLTDNWEKSSGARAEVEEANRVGIPVFTSLAALVMWRDARTVTFMGTIAPVAGEPKREGERWCDMCQDWRGIITTGSELDRCPACADWRRS